MARTLSPEIQTLITQGTQRVCHLLTFTVGIATYRFAEDAIAHLGNAYQPRLVVESGPHYTQTARLDPVKVRLQNITLETAKLLQDEGADVQGQEATLERLFLQVNENEATLVLAGELDPTAAQVPQRKYSSLCAWDFKDTNCGYVDGVDPNDPGTGQPFVSCGKDLLSCQARGRQQRFPGFLTITRELTELVEGNTPSTETDRALSEVLGGL